ncbi:DUF4181 domain-containing protein [Ureibacillus manganicus]|uniref:DUF4181 domain-containing protein n=1 Tax=Ureibacillus manganicus DSM 26584 TaxID=1384049 RepID=A0A0A3IT82_9BACL|nr:DUF4181 domain-containing protein [Ureibacillus manganicus]KGR78032.1 hypothetical protein CD29_12825 [Ureibacillus manganicus DSM 26584]
MGISAPLLVFVVGIANLIVGHFLIEGKRKKISETKGKYIHKWGYSIIATMGIGSLFILDIFDPNVMKWFWLGLLILIIGFQTLLDWKYLKGTKEYLVSLIVLVIGIIYILVVMF